jgi:hypothetical protein
VNVQQHVEEVAFTMLGLTPEQREQAFHAAYEHALAKNPGMTEVPPSVILFVAKVMERIAEFEQLPTGTA